MNIDLNGDKKADVSISLPQILTIAAIDYGAAL